MKFILRDQKFTGKINWNVALGLLAKIKVCVFVATEVKYFVFYTYFACTNFSIWEKSYSKKPFEASMPVLPVQFSTCSF